MVFKNIQVSLLLILSNCVPIYAQQHYNQYESFLKSNSIWAFGNGSGLDFNSGTAVSILTSITSNEGCGAVSDPKTGDLLFYSNGNSVWNANHQVMPNGNGLLGNGASGTTSQGVCIVPVIDTPSKYYLFSLNYQGSVPSVYYSIVNMELENGMGDIEAGRKNIILSNDTLSESMIAIPGENCDIWLLLHTYDKPLFIAYHITRDGLNTVPVVSRAGSMEGDNAYFIGCMAVSPDRKTLAIASYGGDICGGIPNPDAAGVLTAKFDPATGEVSNGFRIIGDTLMPYGVSFSPDNSKLYVTTQGYTIDLWQFDVSVYDSATITNSKSHISSALVQVPSYLRLYNDTIYMNDAGNTAVMHRINQPNLPGAACDFQLAAINLLSPGQGQLGIGNDVVHPLPPDTVGFIVLDTLVCTEDQQGSFNRNLTLEGSSGYYGYQWNTGSEEQITHIDTPGIYWVLCKDSCHSRVDTFIVKHLDLTFDLGPDTFFCEEVKYILNVPIPEASFLWQDGSKDSFMVVENAKGLYWVEVTKKGCNASDSVMIFNKDFTQDLGEDKVFCKGDPINMKLTANIPDGATALWSTGEQGATIIINDSGTYWVTVQEPPCMESDTIKVEIEVCECFISVPNTFSPNGDGINDVFLPIIEIGCPVSNFGISIYNRYGQRVFHSPDPYKGWDGTFNGRPADVGIYFYELNFTGGTRKKSFYQKGDITLLK